MCHSHITSQYSQWVGRGDKTRKARITLCRWSARLYHKILMVQVRTVCHTLSNIDDCQGCALYFLLQWLRFPSFDFFSSRIFNFSSPSQSDCEVKIQSSGDIKFKSMIFTEWKKSNFISWRIRLFLFWVGDSKIFNTLYFFGVFLDIIWRKKSKQRKSPPLYYESRMV